MPRDSVQREALVVTMSIAFDADGREYLFKAGDEVWSDDPVCALLRKHSGRERILVSKTAPRSAWPNYESEARFGAAA